MKQKIISFLMVAVMATGLFSSEIFAAGEDSSRDIVEQKNISVQPDGYLGTMVVMEIALTTPNFGDDWENKKNLCDYSENAVVGEIVYGYDIDKNKDYTKSTSQLVRHRARVYNGSGYHEGAKKNKNIVSSVSVKHSSVASNRRHEYGIILYKAEMNHSYTFVDPE